MKEELTIEDVSMYLPWNVNMIFTTSGDVRELTGVFMEREELRFCFGVINRGQDLWKYKLALRPMSDLNSNVIDYMWFEVLGTENESFDKYKFYEICELGQVQFLPSVAYYFLVS